MKSKERSLYILLLLVVLSTFYYVSVYKGLDYVDSYKNEISALEAKVDSLHSENETLDLQVDTLEGLIVYLGIQTDSLDQIIVNLRKDTDEETDNVDNLTNVELSKFFTDRYRYNISNITRTDSTSSN